MKLSELIKTREVKIPGTDLVIKIKTELSWLEDLERTQIKDPIQRGKFLLTKVILEWNLEDEEKNPLPVTEDIISRLPSSVAIPLSEQITEIINEGRVKKKS